MVMTLKGLKYASLDTERVVAIIYFNETLNLYGCRITFFRRGKKPLRTQSEYGGIDPFRYLENLTGSCLVNLQRLYGGHIKLERFEESAKTKQFNYLFFKKLELAEASPL